MPYNQADGLIARMYDEDYAQLRAESLDAAFYLEEARRSGGPVLELGCGTGRILLPIAEAGLDAVGLDASGAMLARFRDKLEGRGPDLPLVEADMRSFELGRRFRLVTIPFRALAHVTEVAGQLATLACARRHLEPDGRLVFDLFQPNPRMLAEAWGPRCDVEREAEGGTVRRWVSARPHIATQTTQVTFRWEIPDAGGAVRDESVEFPMRWYHRYEVEHLLARTGFAIEALHGGFDRAPFGDDSPEMVFVARPDGRPDTP